MIQWTTPTIRLTISGVEGLDLSEAEEVIVTLTQGTTKIEKTGAALTLDDNVITLTLTEEESAQFSPGSYILAQVNWTFLNADQNKRRAATLTTRIDVSKNTHPEGMIE